MKDIKKFKFELKVFVWYLLTEWWRVFKGFFGGIGGYTSNLTKQIGKTKNWLYIWFTLVVIFSLVGNKYLKGIFILLLGITYLQYEWERKYFMYRWKQKRRNIK